MTYLLTETGKFVSQEHTRVAELVKEYDSTLDLVWIPPEKRDFDEQFPFAILHSPPNREPYIVRKVQACDMNETLIATLYMNDGSKNNRSLNSWLDAQEFARQAMEKKIRDEQNAAQMDFANSVISGKNWYRHTGKVYS